MVIVIDVGGLVGFAVFGFDTDMVVLGFTL